MIHLTEHKQKGRWKNKMDGFTSINVSVKRNGFCQKMQQKDGIVCKHCYAKRVYPMMEARYSANTDLFLSADFQPELVNRTIIRLHSFGELYNELHFQNILSLVNYNPQTTFVLWTKRADIVQNVLKLGVPNSKLKPSNLILIYSSPVLNVISDIPAGFDKVFTVFESTYPDIAINCQKSCKTCMKCYEHNNIVHINEELKLPGNNRKSN